MENYLNPWSYNQSSFAMSASQASMLCLSSQTNSVDTAMRVANPQFTISLWFNALNSQSASSFSMGTLFGKYVQSAALDRNFYIALNTSDKIRVFGSSDGSISTVFFITTATYGHATGWHHLAVTYDYTQTTTSTIAKLYIDGSLISAFDTNTVATTNKFFYNQTTASSRGFASIGCMQTNATASRKTDYFNGSIDEVSYWTTALTQSEITQLYGNKKASDLREMSAYTNSCLAWWRMGDYSGDTYTTTNYWNLQDSGKGTAVNPMNSSGLTYTSLTRDTV